MASDKRTKSKTGDEITVENHGEQNVIAAGRNAKASVFNINIRDLKWQPVVIILVIVGAILSAILWFVIPKNPSIMSGQFNVAVAEFTVQDKIGNLVAGENGAILANYVAGQIETQFNEIALQKVLPFEVWGPDQVKPISGNTAEERRANAAKLAEKIHSQVLIYGVIIADGSQSKFMPEFFVNYKNFYQANEVTGSHNMGSALLLNLPLSNSFLAVRNPGLAGRVNALDLITIGLAFYSVDDYQNAVDYFEQAAAEPRWLETSGKEVAYLLIGNAYLGWASKDDNEQYLSQAEQNYSDSLRIKSNYGRGLVGLANVLYLESLGSLQNVVIDPIKLDEATVLTEQALTLEDQPKNANIPAKAHFNLGQIALARYDANLSGQDWLETARQEFTIVTQDYESGDKTLQTYAAHAYYRLGLIEYTQNKTDASVDTCINLLQKAISLAPPFYRGEYTITLANIYKNLEQYELAAQSYQDAFDIAVTNGDEKSAEKYQKLLSDLNQQ